MRITVIGTKDLALRYALEHFEKKGNDVSFEIFERWTDELRLPEDIAGRIAKMADESDALIVNAEELADAASFAAFSRGIPCFALLKDPPAFAKRTAAFCGAELDALCAALDDFLEKPVPPRFRIALVHDGNPLGQEFLSMLEKEIEAAGHAAESVYFGDIFRRSGFPDHDLFIDFCGSPVLTEFFASKEKRLVRPVSRRFGPDSTFSAIMAEIGRLPKNGRPVFADISRAGFMVGDIVKTGYSIEIDGDDRAMVRVEHAAGGQARARVSEDGGKLSFHVLENDLPEDDVQVSGVLIERLADGVVTSAASFNLGKRRGKSVHSHETLDFGNDFSRRSLEEREAFFRD